MWGYGGGYLWGEAGMGSGAKWEDVPSRRTILANSAFFRRVAKKALPNFRNIFLSRAWGIRKEEPFI